jgi:hypothetical protein
MLRSLISKIEREQNQQSIKTRLEKPLPKSDHRQIILTRLLTQRVDVLRQEFITNRLNLKTALVKEQVQTQRIKQQQLILKQQPIKQEEQSNSDDNDNKNIKDTSPPPPPAKKPRKSNTKEVKNKRPKSSEQKTKR